jgi:subtilase family serine protease
MSNCKRRLISGALVILLLLAGWYAPAWSGGTEARVFAAAMPAPDLVIESLALSPDSPSIGDTLTFSVTIKNQGDLPAGESHLTCSIDEANLATITVEPIDSGAATIKTFTWKAQAGPHVFRALIDSENNIAESIENNNDRTLAFSALGPDLAIDAISWTPANPATGNMVTFTVKVVNQGDKRAGISHVDFFIDGSSRGPRSILGIEPGAGADIIYMWIAVPGVHNVRATADILNQVVESDEANNTSEATCATREPDLVISSISLSPESISENTEVTFTVNIKNQGGSQAGPSSLTFYIDGGQQDSVLLGLLNPGAVTSANFTWIAGSQPRTFKAFVDADNRIKESDETNNTGSVIFPTFFPDLIIQDITWTPSTPILHDFVSFSVIVKNQGKCASSATELKFVIDAANFFSAVIPELPAGASTTAIFNWMTQSYSHSIKVSIDEANLIKESIESNNTMTKTVISIKLAPSADLIVEKFTYSPAKPIIGESITFTLGVKNQGSGKATPSYAGIYIDGKLMDETYINELEAGATLTKDIIIPLQGLTFKDTYIAKVSLDDHNSVYETNDLNNQKEISFSIVAPDLIIQTVRWSPEAPAAGNTVTFDVTAKNRGDLKAGATNISYYVDNVFMGKHRIEGIEPGTTATRSFTWAAQKDSFLFTAVIDEAGEISEKDESNNSRTVTLPAPDLLIDSITWSPENPAEIIPVTFTAVIRNRGYARSAGTLLSCYYDSAAPISLETGEISPGGTATVVFTYSFVSGEHTLRLIADVNDTIAESDEANNEKTVRFSVQPRPSSVPASSANSSLKAGVKTPAPTLAAAGNISQASPLLNKTPAPTPAKDVTANITASPPKWQSIIQSKLFIIGFGIGGVGVIAILLLLRKKASKK